MKLRDYYDSLTRDEKLKFVSGMAVILGISEKSARNCIYGIREVGSKNCLKVSALTGYKVSLYELRPDIFPQK